MGCEKKCENLNMAQIPYIEHQRRMFKMYDSKKKIKIVLITTNVIWAALFTILMCMR